MQDVTIRKPELLQHLSDNRSKHRQVFEAALEGYRKEAIRRLQDRVRKLRDGKIPNLFIGLTEPEDHTKDYDRVIMMVEMHVGDNFILDESSFGSYVMDDWHWKRQFYKSSNTYAAATVAEVYGDEAAEDA
jgi:hypothetical protein